jgi:hypothetical protein
VELKIIKGSESTRSLPKKSTSLGRIKDQNQFVSPYRKKSVSIEKTKTVPAFLTRTGRSSSTDNIKSKQAEVRTKTKDSGVSTQMIQFQNAIPYRSTPNSPTSKRTSRP